MISEAKPGKNKFSWQAGRCYCKRNAATLAEAATDKKNQPDINALADEYLRLAYHGLRAKDKSFNATMQNRF